MAETVASQETYCGSAKDVLPFSLLRKKIYFRIKFNNNQGSTIPELKIYFCQKKMQKIIVLGCGMVGSAIAADLSESYSVTAVDIDSNPLDSLKSRFSLETITADLSDEEVVTEIIRSFDLVISAVPGFLGWQTINRVIRSGKNLVDISFLPEDILPLDEVAKAHGVTAIVDCGVAPGIPNIIAGHWYRKSKIHRFEYMVGGLPEVRSYPFWYKAPFSPCDVIEEYTRPARMKEDGRIVTKPAMSETELVDFESVGTLEAFNSDGLRSLLFTLPDIPEMKEKTLRYPGHIDLIKALKAAGFFEHDPLTSGGREFIPFETTSEILKKAWKLNPDEKEFTIMKIILDLEDGSGRREIVYDLFDRYDDASGFSSMARTTGYTCTAAANLILKGGFNEKGLFPPENIGIEQKDLDFIFSYLAKRNVNLSIKDYADRI